LDTAGVDLDDDGLFLKQRSNGTKQGHYETTIHMKTALDRHAILAWQVDDAPLTLETGFPLRLIDFGLFNYKCVKALESIEVTRENKLGHWEAHSGYDLDGTVQPKKYYAVDLQRKVWFGGTGEVMDEDL
jgi:DMSO/TMAO reductase YedYZ molybdopterin-dependent catalytic subunit